MKKLIILSLFFGLASSLLLHSQAIKVTNDKAIKVGLSHALVFGNGKALPNRIPHIVNDYIPPIAVNATLCVYDLTGSQILKMDIAGRENGSISINANQLKVGMYMYALLVDGKEVDVKRMILTGK